MPQILKLILYFYIILVGYYAKDIDVLVFHMNNHLLKDVPQKSLFQPEDSGTSMEKCHEPYIFNSFPCNLGYLKEYSLFSIYFETPN